MGIFSIIAAAAFIHGTSRLLLKFATQPGFLKGSLWNKKYICGSISDIGNATEYWSLLNISIFCNKIKSHEVSFSHNTHNHCDILHKIRLLCRVQIARFVSDHESGYGQTMLCENRIQCGFRADGMYRNDHRLNGKLYAKLQQSRPNWRFFYQEYRMHIPIARFVGPTWGPSGADRSQVGPMLAPWTL